VVAEKGFPVGVRIEILPFLFAAVCTGIILVLVLRIFRMKAHRAFHSGVILAFVLSVFFFYFFRDPDRTAPDETDVIVAAADGKIAKITPIGKDEFMGICRGSGLSEDKLEKVSPLTQADSIRISIFLSLFDVHVNRAPISGDSEFLGYFPGKRYFTFQDKSSTENQHNAIFMRNERTCCLINQIVGPVARRVVYWPSHDKKTPLKMGDRIGMMKFGSRLDLYFPKDDITVVAKEGDKVLAGETVIARLNLRQPAGRAGEN
jgi:phosphatidylserine decarboxylase